MQCPAIETTRAYRYGYIWALDQAQTLMRKGVRQQRCTNCARLYWPHEVDEHAIGMAK